MDIRHLEYFTTVAKYLSFTKASHKLHISQPTISKMIKSLEEELGVTLFYRSPRIALTDAGRALFRQSKNILNSFDNIESELADVMTMKKGNIRIGLPPIIGASFFPQIIGEFKELYPKVDIQIIEVGSKKIEEGIEDGTLDIGVVCTIPTKKDTFDMFSFIKSPLMVIVHPEHKLASNKIVSFKDLENEPFVLYREDFSLHDIIIKRCILQNGFQPQIICESSQRDFMVEMVAAKLGISFLPQKICLELDSKRIRAVSLKEPHIYLHLAMIWKKNRYISFASREWLKFTSSKFDINLSI